MPWALRAQELLANDWNVSADVWSVTSWGQLRRQADEVAEHNLLHPEEEPQVPYVTSRLQEAHGPVIAVSDWMRAVPDLIAPYAPHGMQSLGTDGFGLSDTRPALRRHFHVDAESIVVRTLASLADWNQLDREVVRQAVEKYQVRDVQAAPGGGAVRREPRDLAGLTTVARALRVTVVGGGVIGLTCALELARAGHRVTVLDGGPGRGDHLRRRRRALVPLPGGARRRRAALGGHLAHRLHRARGRARHRGRACAPARSSTARRGPTCGGRRP